MRLPDYYRKWLETIDTNEEVSYRDSEFYLFSENELTEEIKIDKNVVKSFNQLQALMMTQIEATGSSPLTVEQCHTCITIGEDNGNPIFFNTGRDSELFCYYMDGGYIEEKGGNLLSLTIEARNT